MTQAPEATSKSKNANLNKASRLPRCVFARIMGMCVMDSPWLTPARPPCEPFSGQVDGVDAVPVVSEPPSSRNGLIWLQSVLSPRMTCGPLTSILPGTIIHLLFVLSGKALAAAGQSS